MAIQPDTDVRLLKCKLTMDNKNQFTFASKKEQADYFLSLPYIEIDDCSYQRKDNIIRYPAHIDDIIEYNYVMYKNNNYSDKWFYAFIINMEYQANNLTYITIATDVWQTWGFDIEFKESFVEREHVSRENDSSLTNLEPENVEMGEPIISSVADLSELKPSFVIAYSRDPYADNISSHPVGLYVVNGMPNGVYYYVCGRDELTSKIEEINTEGLGQNVITIFSIPIGAVVGNTDYDGNDWTKSFLYTHENYGDWVTSFSADELYINYPTFSTFGGYQPKNNKLYHYPFSYLGFCPPNRFTKNI